MANFMTEQLDGDLKRQEKVKDGTLTQVEADEEAVEWEKVRFYSLIALVVTKRNDGWFYHR